MCLCRFILAQILPPEALPLRHDQLHVRVLVDQGVGLGTALAFMMAVTALSLPSLIMLKKVVRAPLLALFFGIVTAGIMVIGYLFNAFAYLFI